jgi:hypothetical protein
VVNPSALKMLSRQHQHQNPSSPECLAEDARRLADFHRTRQAVPWEDVKAWMLTWGTPRELPAPKPRKL